MIENKVISKYSIRLPDVGALLESWSVLAKYKQCSLSKQCSVLRRDGKRG